MFRLYNQYKLRINYKSGTQEEVWMYSYTVKRGDTVPIQSIEYDCVGKSPIILNVDNIESIWIIEARKGILGGKR